MTGFENVRLVAALTADGRRVLHSGHSPRPSSLAGCAFQPDALHETGSPVDCPALGMRRNCEFA